MNTKDISVEEKAIHTLQELAPPASRIYVVVRYVSSNGMRRHMSFFAIQHNVPMCLDRLIVDAGLFPWNKARTALLVSGCGMDMGFHVVYELAYLIYKNGYALYHSWL